MCRVIACMKDKVRVKQVDIKHQGNTTVVSFPDTGWEDFSETPLITESFDFTFAQIVSYFVNRSVCDGLPAGDFKAINKSAENLFICGHIQNIQVCLTDDHLLMKAKCLPEMRKDRVYFLKMALNVNTFDIFLLSVVVLQVLGLKEVVNISVPYLMHWQIFVRLGHYLSTRHVQKSYRNGTSHVASELSLFL